MKLIRQDTLADYGYLDLKDLQWWCVRHAYKRLTMIGKDVVGQIYSKGLPVSFHRKTPFERVDEVELGSYPDPNWVSPLVGIEGREFHGFLVDHIRKEIKPPHQGRYLQIFNLMAEWASNREIARAIGVGKSRAAFIKARLIEVLRPALVRFRESERLEA